MLQLIFQKQTFNENSVASEFEPKHNLKPLSIFLNNCFVTAILKVGEK